MTKELEKEYLEDLDHYDEGMGIHSTSYKNCKERLIRLAKIDSASPSEALERLERIKKLQVCVDYEKDIVKSVNEIMPDSCDKVQQALLKAQEDEKLKIDICEMFGLDNLFPYNDTDAILKELEEYMDRHNQLFVDSAKKSKKLKEQEKDLKKYNELNKTFDDSHICEIKKELSKYEPLCEESKCDECALGIGDVLCLKNMIERKWELRDELQSQEKELAKYKKAWRVIVEKRVSISLLNACDCVSDYNQETHNLKGLAYGLPELTEEEFELIKEMIECQNH